MPIKNATYDLAEGKEEEEENAIDSRSRSHDDVGPCSLLSSI